ncbi:protocatechuate 3,4-dioxygenase [Vibrio sp. WXL210]|uniref:dioxygenase family protein n=1 Tax=Vibrio sp. WXL210 TaxID=3450709 RepID=UPI003EC76B41
MQRRHFILIPSIALMWPFSLRAARSVTPSQAEGPFYPVVDIPLQSNLIVDKQHILGQVLELNGDVVDNQGQPMSGIRIEIWQCDAQGFYQHPRQANVARFDPAFRGFGAVLTDSNGRFHFTTIYPVPYNRRPPHIHVKLWQDNTELLTTQLYLKGNTGNEWWGGSERALLQIAPVERPEGHLDAQFSFVITA